MPPEYRITLKTLFHKCNMIYSKSKQITNGVYINIYFFGYIFSVETDRIYLDLV